MSANIAVKTYRKNLIRAYKFICFYIYLIFAGELDDLSAQIGALDRAQVLLIALSITRVLIKHVGGAGLDLRLDYGRPELLSLDAFTHTTLSLVPLVQPLELLAPHVRQAGTLVRTHERPVAVRLHSLHEQVRDPEGEEEIARAHLLLARVLLGAEEVEDVAVPGLQVDGERAGPLVAALVHVARGVVVDAEHWNEAVACAVSLRKILRMKFSLAHEIKFNKQPLREKLNQI